MTDTTLSLPLFWGYITVGGKLMIGEYRHKNQVLKAQDNKLVRSVICPFRAENVRDAQDQITANYSNFDLAK